MQNIQNLFVGETNSINNQNGQTSANNQNVEYRKSCDGGVLLRI